MTLPLSAHLGNTQLGPVESALVNTVLNKEKSFRPKRETLRCETCSVNFNSQGQADTHYRGKRHARITEIRRRKRELKEKESATCTDEASIAQLPASKEELTMEQMACAQEQVAALATEDLARQAQEDTIETFKAENCKQLVAEHAQMISASAENGSVSSNQPFSTLDPLEIREETEEEKKARLEMEEEVKKMLENLPPYVKRVVRTIKPLDESLHCKECDVWVNSDTQMKQHLGSLRHKNTIAGVPVPPRPDKIEPVKPRSNHQYKCELCHVTLNSEVQLLQHLRSQRHKATLEGKPPKPRWVPYERFREQQRIQAKIKLQSAYAAAYQPILVPNFTHMAQMGHLGHAQSQMGAMQNVQNVQGMALPPGMQFVQLM